jgi:NAD(P)-dependent dehydrogenase (short-subunit alcohol dehydrogenase family)
MKPKTVFITGASGALGSFITGTFLKTGARVIGAAIPTEGAMVERIATARARMN